MHRRDAFLLAAATGVIGATFGVLAEEAGFTLAQAMGLSALVFTGASQFAAATVIAAGGTALAAVASGLILAARNALYGPSIARLLGPQRWQKALASHFVIDETTAMALSQPDDERSRDAFWFTGIWLFTLWNVGTALGVVAGQQIADPAAWGLDAAFPAAFVALVLPLVRTPETRRVAGTAAVLTLVAIPFTPAGVPILVSSAAVAVARRRR